MAIRRSSGYPAMMLMLMMMLLFLLDFGPLVYEYVTFGFPYCMIGVDFADMYVRYSVFCLCTPSPHGIVPGFHFLLSVIPVVGYHIQ